MGNETGHQKHGVFLKIVLTAMPILLVALLFPVLSSSPASAESQIANYSLALDGTQSLVTDDQTANPSSDQVVLGQTDGDNTGVDFCIGATQCFERFAGFIGDSLECGYERVTLSDQQGCQNAAAAWNQAKQYISDKIASSFELQIRTALVGVVERFTKWVVVDELGGNTAIALPTVDCKVATGPAASGCQDGWFLGQFSLMRKLSIFMILPLLMLVVMQSIIRGSLFLLMRAVLVMLPVAILGMVAAVTITQLLLNITDAISLGIVKHLVNTDAYGGGLNAVFERMKAGQGQWFGLLWMGFFFFACIAIFFELVIRETGIYISMLILPIGFAALVWPSTAKWAKRLIELLIGLIFSKVFIVAAMAMGITAVSQPNVGFFSHTVDYGTGGAPTSAAIPDGDQSDKDLAQVMAGAMIMFTAAFGAVKVMQMAGPAAIAGTVGNGRLVSPMRVLVMGQVANTAIGWAASSKVKTGTVKRR